MTKEKMVLMSDAQLTSSAKVLSSSCVNGATTCFGSIYTLFPFRYIRASSPVELSGNAKALVVRVSMRGRGCILQLRVFTLAPVQVSVCRYGYDQPRPGIAYTDWYSSKGSPTFSISGIVHFRSNAFERTILKICKESVVSATRTDGEPTFCTLILWLVLEKIRAALIALANRLA
jgi:hypothetical protein